MRRPVLLASAAVGAVIMALVASAPAQAAPPANDDLAAAQTITGPSGGFTTTTQESTIEPGEKAPGICGAIDESIWFRWVAPTDSVLSIGLDYLPGTTNFQINSEITVYTLSSPGTPTLGSLHAIGCSNDSGLGWLSRVHTRVTAGTTYFVQVTHSTTLGDEYPSAPVELNWQTGAAPANDDLAGATEIVPGVATTIDTTFATSENGRPQPPGYAQVNPYFCNTLLYDTWLTWTPTTDVRVNLDMGGPDVNHVLGASTIWSGPDAPTVDDLGWESCENNETTRHREADFWATHGVTYYFQIGQFGDESHSGSVGTDRVTLTAGDPPANDEFTHAARVEAPTVVHFDNRLATSDPDFDGSGCFPQKEVWYRFHTRSAGTVHVATSNPGEITMQGAVVGFAGPDSPTLPSQFTALDCDDSFDLPPGHANDLYLPQVDVPVVAGQDYYVEIGSDFAGPSESADLTFTTTTSTALTTQVHGQSVRLRAAVSSPLGDAGGSVEFVDTRAGDASLGTVPVTGGIATLDLPLVTMGTHEYEARFTPISPDLYGASTSPEAEVILTQQQTTTSVSAPQKVKQGHRATISVSVKDSVGEPATGRVVVTVAGRATSLTLVNGVAKVTTGKLKKAGTVRVTAAYAGAELAAPSSGTATITVKKKPKKSH